MMLLSSLELYAERAKAKETERWAKLVADMVSADRSTTFEVKHTFASLRPELDELIASKIASAMSAQRAETQSGSGLQPASAVPERQTPKGDA